MSSRRSPFSLFQSFTMKFTMMLILLATNVWLPFCKPGQWRLLSLLSLSLP